MSVVQQDDIQQVWDRIKAWPQPTRLSLASKILQSLEAEQTRPKKSLADLVGILATDQPPPTDEDVERILRGRAAEEVRIMRVLLDTNILLDILLKRLPWEAEAVAIWRASEESRLISNVTSLSVANMFYVARRHAGQEKAIRAVHQCLQVCNILPVDRSTLQAGLALPGKDFEDNLQIVAAVDAGLDAVVTRNPSDFAACPLPVLTPQQLLARLSGGKP